MNANIITIVGRLAAKPHLKGYTKSDGTDGFRSFMRVAVTRLGDLGKPQADRRTNYVPVVAWGGLAQRIAQHLDKGTEVTVVGELIAESRVRKDAAGNPIVVDGKTQYDEFIHIQANSCQFGRKSMKNATPADVNAQLAALQSRMEAMAAGAGTEAAATAPPASASGDTPALEGDGNPFETSDAA